MVFGLVGSLFTLRAPAANDFAQGELAKILFFHLPAAILTVVTATFAAVWAVRYLRGRNAIHEVKMGAALDFSGFLSAYTMFSGILFSKSQWGEWYHGDPRQTSFLFVLLILGAGLSLRGAISDPDQRAKISAAYTAFSYLPILFLITVYPRLPQVANTSLHPSDTIQKGRLDSTYSVGVLLIIVSLCAFWSLVTRLRTEAFLSRQSHELDADHSAPGPVVRPRPDARP